MKYLILVLLVAGCGQKPSENKVISSAYSYDVICLNGVKYYESVYTLAPVVENNGKYFALCD